MVKEKEKKELFGFKLSLYALQRTGKKPTVNCKARLRQSRRYAKLQVCGRGLRLSSEGALPPSLPPVSLREAYTSRPA